MGLDMNLFAIKHTNTNTDVDQGFGSENPTIELAYWRKANHIHGWMETLYKAKGGTQEFNCTSVRLSKQDIKDLFTEVKDNTLTPTAGFFFGGDNRPDDVDIYTLSVLFDALYEITGDYDIYYTSWW